MCNGCVSLPDITKKIARHGWAVTAVAGSGDDVPDFAYSSGLTDKRLPELIVYGLPVHLAASLINDVAFYMVAGFAGFAVTAGSTVQSPTGETPDIATIEVIDTSDMVVTTALYDNFSALQLVWPDMRGAYPWDPKYAICERHQPLMGVGWV